MIRAWLSHSRLPEIIAAETAECGLACVAMIYHYYGNSTPLFILRNQFSPSLQGATLQDLVKTAHSLGFSTRALRLEMPDFRNLRRPAILHWNMNHFVVLRDVTRRGAIIHDPGVGARHLSWSEVSESFTGVALELEPTTQLQRTSSRFKFKLSALWSHSSGLAESIARVILLALCFQLVSMAGPLQLQLSLDQVTEGINDSVLLVIFAAFCALAFLQSGLSAARDWAIQSLSGTAIYQITGNVVRQLLSLPVDFFERRHSGDLLSRVEGLAQVRESLTSSLLATLFDGLTVVVVMLALFAYSVALAAIVLIFFAISAGFVLAASRPIYTATQEKVIAASIEQTHLLETVRGIMTIRANQLERRRESQWRNLYVRALNASLDGTRAQATLNAILLGAGAIQTALIIFVGGREVIHGGGMTIGMYVAFVAFQQMVIDRSRAIFDRVSQFRVARVLLERVGEIVAARSMPAIISAGSDDVSGAIEMRGVTYSYGDLDRCTVLNASLKIEPNEFVALTGPSGGGKTTIFKLLSGLYEPTEGKIYLDGRVATPQAWSAFYEQMGIVFQEDRLFAGSILENICLFEANRDGALAEESARMARVHDEIEHMLMKYRTYIGEMGSALSGGQRQRILIARAFYRKPKVLMMDEGTANLDTDNELEIARTIRSMNCTRVIVAHRPALLDLADRVINVIDGRLQ